MAQVSKEWLILICAILLIYGVFFTFLYYATMNMYENLEVINESLLYGCVLSFLK